MILDTHIFLCTFKSITGVYIRFACQIMSKIQVVYITEIDSFCHDEHRWCICIALSATPVYLMLPCLFLGAINIQSIIHKATSGYEILILIS